MGFIDRMTEQALKNQKKLVLPEGTDKRVINAAKILSDKGLIAEVWLVGDEAEIQAAAQAEGVVLDGRIRMFIAAMPEQRRKVFIMSRYKGMGNKSIAETLGISVRTVDRHINIALTSLKKEFLMK